MLRIHTYRRLSTVAAVALTGMAAPSQDIVISEIGGAAAASWIELHNRSTAPADLSNWSIYLATATVGRPQNYWWGFPTGTTVPGHGYLLVRWLQPAPATPIAGEVATGTSQFTFLFGLGAEDLPLARGGLALLSSQQNAAMNSASIFTDWVTWGAGGLPRETLAVQAGRWQTGHATPARSGGGSLARHPTATSSGDPETVWFTDATPTPGGDNVGSAAVAALGSACAPAGHHLLGAPVLLTTSTPVIGNTAFALRVTNTTGAFLEHCLFVIGTSSVPGGLQGVLPAAPGADACIALLDPSAAIDRRLLHTQLMATNLPLSLGSVPAELAGATFTVQALVFDLATSTWPPYQGLTNALVVTLGN